MHQLKILKLRTALFTEREGMKRLLHWAHIARNGEGMLQECMKLMPKPRFNKGRRHNSINISRPWAVHASQTPLPHSRSLAYSFSHSRASTMARPGRTLR